MEQERWRKLSFNPLGQSSCMYYTHRTAYALNSVHIQKGETREVYVFMLCLHGDSFACVRVSVLTRMNGIVSCAEEQYSVVQYAPLYVGS